MAKQRILVADDEPQLMKIIAMRLELAGFEVIMVRNGRDALDKMKAVRPDLLVLDWLLPKLSGEAVCSAIKHDPDIRHIPVIIYSASTELDNVKTQSDDKFGPDACIDKLKGTEVLIENIRSLLGR